MAGSTGGGGDRRLIDVFIDRGCEAVPDAAVRKLSARRVDVLNPGTALERGGVLLLGPRIADAASSLTALRELRRWNPSLIVYVCARAGSSLLREVTDYARAGADELFTITSASDVADLVEHVLERIAAPPPEIELRAVGTLRLPPHLLLWVQHAFRNAYRHRRIGEVGRALGQAVRRIDEELQNQNLPCLRDLWRCGQYSHGVELERRGVADANERARRTQLGTATDVTRFKYRLRVTMRRNPRLASFAAPIPSLAFAAAGMIVPKRRVSLSRAHCQVRPLNEAWKNSLTKVFSSGRRLGSCRDHQRSRRAKVKATHDSVEVLACWDHGKRPAH